MITAKLSPSDFAFLYKDCKRCFWLKHNKQILQPSKPMAAIFNKIDSQQKKLFHHKRLNDICGNLPKGRIIASDVWVKSQYIPYTDLDYQHYILGKLDSLMKMDDGSYQVIDFKTSDVSAHVQLYAKQLHAYAYSLEHPMKTNEGLDAPISGIGLIIFDPSLGFSAEDEKAALRGTLTWKPIRYTPDKFEEFMLEIAGVIASPDEPPFNEECPYCQRDKYMKEGAINNA